MPSNKDLITGIGEEATAKGVDTPDTEGKNNAELADILKELKGDAPPPPENGAEAAELARKEAKEKRDQEAADAAAEAEKNKPAYTVATGKAITCKKGIVSDGDEVKASYFNDEKTLKDLVKKGFIVKN